MLQRVLINLTIINNNTEFHASTWINRVITLHVLLEQAGTFWMTLWHA